MPRFAPRSPCSFPRYSTPPRTTRCWSALRPAAPPPREPVARLRTSSPDGRKPNSGKYCSGWSAPRSPRCSPTPTRTRWARPPASSCPRRWSSTTRTPRPSPGTCVRSSVARRRRRWPRRSRRPTSTSRSPSSAWPAATPAESPRPTTSGTWFSPKWTPSATFRTTAAGTSPRSTTPTPTTRARPMSVRAGSFTTPVISTRSSSASARARPWPPTRSSGCCWRPAGRRSSTRASTRPR